VEEYVTVPHSREAEEAVLGSVLVNPECYGEAAGVLTPGGGDFYIHRHRFIWAALETLDAAGEPIDSLTVSTRLEDMGRLEEIGGPAFLTALLNQTPTSLHVVAYAEIVRDRAARRQLLALATTQATLAYDFSKPLGDILGVIDRGLVGVVSSAGENRGAIISGAQAVAAAMAATEKAADPKTGDSGAVPTGLTDLDARLGGGFFPGDLVVIAARSGEGKTALMATMAVNIAGLHRVDTGGKTSVNFRPRKVAFISMEMTNTGVVNRMIAQITGISASRLRAGQIGEDDWEPYYQAVEQISRSGLYFDDFPSARIAQLRVKIKSLVERGVEIIFLDQLSFLDAQSNGANESQALNYLAHRLKDICRELNTIIVVAHQMNRNVEKKGENDDPTLADLDQAGDKPASVVIFIRHKKSGDIFQSSWLVLGKHREGPAGGRIPVTYLASRTRFENCARMV